MAKKQSQLVLDADTMQKLLKKKVFVRAAPSVVIPYNSSASASVNEYMEATAPIVRQQKVTQDKFLAELDPRSHDINNRALYPDKVVKGDDGKSYLTEIARVIDVEIKKKYRFV